MREALEQTQELLPVALSRIEELEKQKTPLPVFVIANVKKPEAGEKKARTKRDAQFNRGRHRMQATQSVEHQLVTRSGCHLRLGGGMIKQSSVPSGPHKGYLEKKLSSVKNILLPEIASV